MDAKIATTGTELIELPPNTNRAMRRDKGRRLTNADMRRWHAENIRQKLFAKKESK